MNFSNSSTDGFSELVFFACCSDEFSKGLIELMLLGKITLATSAFLLRVIGCGRKFSIRIIPIPFLTGVRHPPTNACVKLFGKGSRIASDPL